MKRLRLSPAKWLAASLFGLVLMNLALVTFVTALDRLSGQPPQLTVPLFALLIASATLIATRKRRSRQADLYEEIEGEEERAPLSPQRSNAPVYISMTIIRRPSVMTRPSESDRFEEVVQ